MKPFPERTPGMRGFMWLLSVCLQRCSGLHEHEFLFFTLAVTALCFLFYGYGPALGNWIRDAGLQTAAVCAIVAVHVLWIPL